MFSYSSSSSDSKKYATERSYYISEIRGYEYGSVAPNSVETISTPLPMGGLLETDLTNVSTITTRNALVYNKTFNLKHRITLQAESRPTLPKPKENPTHSWGYMPDRGETFATADRVLSIWRQSILQG